MIVADNVMTAAIIQTERLLDGLQAGEHGEANAHTRAVYNYIKSVCSNPNLTTQLVPIGGGIAISYRHAAETEPN